MLASYCLLLFLPLATNAICPTTLPTDAAFATGSQYHSGDYGSASSTHLLSLSPSAPSSSFSLAYNLVSGSFMKTPSTQCPETCLNRLRAMGKPGKDGSSSSIIMMWDAAGASPPATNLLYAAYTTTVLPGEYLYCSNVAGTCGASVPLYLYYNAETDDYQLRNDKDTVDDEAARLQNMGLPVCWMFPALPTTSSSTSTVAGSSTTTSYASSTSAVSGSTTTTTAVRGVEGASSTTVVGGSTTSSSGFNTGSSTTTTTYSGPPTTSTSADFPAASSTTTTPYTGPPTTTSTPPGPHTTSTTATPYTGPSTTADQAASTTSASGSSGIFSTLTTVRPTTTTSPYVYAATTDAAGTYGPGDQKLENGTVIRPNGDMIYPNGTVKTGDGAIIEGGKKTDPDGTVHNPDGSTKYPNGTVVYPNGATTPVVGSAGKTGDDTPTWVIPVIIVGSMIVGAGSLAMIVFGVTSMMKSAPHSTVSPYDVPNSREQWPNQRQPTPPSADLPPPVYEPVMTAQPQSFGATQTLAGAPNPLYFG